MNPRQFTMMREDEQHNTNYGLMHSRTRTYENGHQESATMLAGEMNISHSQVGDQSWHNYSHDETSGYGGYTESHYTRERPVRQGMDESGELRRQLHGGGSAGFAQPRRSSVMYSFPHGSDLPLFVNMGSEGNERESKVDYLRMSERHRALMPTMLGVAQFDARQRGNTLVPGDDLSPHSAPLVNRLHAAGMVKGERVRASNNLDFGTPMMARDVEDMTHLLGMGSYDKSRVSEVSHQEMESGRRAGRGIVRAAKGPKPPQKYEQGTLF